MRGIPFTHNEIRQIIALKQSTPPTPTKLIATTLNRPLRSVQLWVERLKDNGYKFKKEKRGRKPVAIPQPK